MCPLKGDPNYSSQPSPSGPLTGVDNVISPAVIRLFVNYQPLIDSVNASPNTHPFKGTFGGQQGMMSKPSSSLRPGLLRVAVT